MSILLHMILRLIRNRCTALAGYHLRPSAICRNYNKQFHDAKALLCVI